MAAIGFGFVIALLYGVIYTFIEIIKTLLHSNRSKGQKRVCLIGNILIFLFCVWIYSWSHDFSISCMALGGLFFTVNPLLLAFTVPKKKSESCEEDTVKEDGKTSVAVILIVEALLLCICLAAGAETGHIGLALCVWAFLAVISALMMMDGVWKADTPEGREQWRREKERDEKEWRAWRYMEEYKNKNKKK